MLRLLSAVARFVLLLLVNSLRLVLGIGLLGLFFGFLILFALEFPHSSKWDSWGWIVLLRKWGHPILAQIDVWLQWPPAKPYYSFVLAILSAATQIILDSYLVRIHFRLRRRRRIMYTR